MIVKRDDINLDNLDPLLKTKLIQLDELHKYVANHELVITSTNDDKHWGSTRKPADWRTWSEKRVREVSNSKHYIDQALDFRNWYLNSVSKKKKDMFKAGCSGLFPNDTFDLVEEGNHWHLEIDRKPVLGEPDIRQPKDYAPPVDLEEKDPIELQKPDDSTSVLEEVNWRIMPKAILNGAFRYFTKFNLFLTTHRPSWIDKLIEMLKALINKLTKKGN